MKVNSNRLVVIVAGFAVAAALGAPCTASADLFYTPSQYNRLYSDKVAVELELKMLKRQYRNELDNLKKENSGLKGRIEALTGRLDLLTKRCEEERKYCASKIRELEQHAEIMKMNSSDREKALIDEAKRIEEHCRDELDRMRKQISDEREASLRKYESSSDDCAKRTADLQARISDLTDEISDLRKLTASQKQELARMSTQAQELEKQLEDEIRKGDIKIRRFHDRLIININDKILFKSGSAALKPEVSVSLEKIAKVLNNYPENRIQVEGHTDNVPIRGGEFRDNWQLSSERALAVLAYLLREKKLNPERFSAVGYGEHNPIVPNTTPDNRALNRRVDITVAPMLRK